METDINEEGLEAQAIGKYIYTQTTHPWLHDSSIALLRDRTSGSIPWQTDTLQLLEKEWIDFVQALDRRCTILADVATQQVPFITDLTPQHLDKLGANEYQRQIYANVMSIVRRRWREFSMLRAAVIEHPQSLISAYIAELETGAGEWAVKEPFWNKVNNKLDGLPVLQRLAQAWAIVELNRDVNGNANVEVKKWMKRGELVWYEKTDNVWFWWEDVAVFDEQTGQIKKVEALRYGEVAQLELMAPGFDAKDWQQEPETIEDVH